MCTKNALLKVKESIDMGMEEDFFSIDLMDAYEHLGLIIGETARDDLADKIFKEFCMGNRLQDIRYWKEDICMPVLNEEYDVVVVGAGHAGCEAALASARLGLNTIILR